MQKIIWNPEKKCCTWEDRSKIKRGGLPGCRGHKSGIGNLYKCNSLACDNVSYHSFDQWLLKDLYNEKPRPKTDKMSL